MKVLIGTPTAGGIAKIQYSTSVLSCANAVAEVGGRCELVTFDGAHLVVARNYIAHRTLIDPEVTHVLSLDSDMDVDIDVFRRMIAADAGRGSPYRRSPHVTSGLKMYARPSPSSTGVRIPLTALSR